MGERCDGERVDVAIVGAGLAGLAAAQRLRVRHGIDAALFEAQPRAGGRVQSHRVVTCNARQLTLDLGATWFHGTVANAAYALVCDPQQQQQQQQQQQHPRWEEGDCALLFSTAAIVVDDEDHDDDVAARPPRARRAPPQQSLPVARAFDAALDDLPIGGGGGGTDRALRDAVRDAVRYGELSRFDRGVVHALEHLQCCYNGCSDSTAQLSAQRMHEYVQLRGDNVRPPRASGMAVVVHALLAALHPAQLRLNAPVTAVHWRGAQHARRAQLLLADGSRCAPRVVLWTPSVNVTKRAVERGVFRPPLPPPKLRALQQRGQGVVEKVFVLLQQPLRKLQTDAAVPVVWLCRPPSADVLPCAAWCTAVYAIHYCQRDRVVSFWLHGAAALQLSALPERRAERQLSALLSLLCAQPVAVAAVVRSHWARNPFVLGSYSYPQLRCPPRAVHLLAQPLPSSDHPRLCFAGEATHPRYYSTMHAAVESGYREADRIAAYLARSPPSTAAATASHLPHI